MFKHNIGQLVWFMHDNAVCAAPVLSRCYIDNGDKIAGTRHSFGDTSIRYYTCFGQHFESRVFANKDSLLNHLGANAVVKA